eukprot:15451546-Alexandrium_andersonii.AAC.1
MLAALRRRRSRVLPLRFPSPAPRHRRRRAQLPSCVSCPEPEHSWARHSARPQARRQEPRPPAPRQ